MQRLPHCGVKAHWLMTCTVGPCAVAPPCSWSDAVGLDAAFFAAFGQSAVLAAQHQSFATIVMQALGGKPKGTAPMGKDPNAIDVTAGATSVEDAVLRMNRMLSF